jgi:pimeloyl-[acyl-carrier protein] methyl ester esterase
MPFITAADGTQLFYEASGSGRPLIFVHGWAMSGRVWHFQAGAFAGSRQVIVPDLRGHGRSVSATAEPFSMAGFAGDLALLCAELELEQATLVGWSMGVQIVLEAFPLLRERVAALVLVGGTPRFTAAADYPYGLPPTEARGMALRLKRDYSGTMGAFFASMFAEGELVGDAYQRVVREVVLPGRRPEPAAALQSLIALSEADQRGRLTGIDCPTLIVHGSADTICLPDAARYMAERIPSATLEVMAGCGHAPFLSRPEEFNKALSLFLEKVYANH